ncbi:hypothetical protein [uncultured Anaerotruncus sp.]|uniref:hypothetical protein n=1 Tax=uncultured Anaerotruncus sp. TaxID=905011 RepID=UPI00280BD1DD|nr:hypothetical protein [uncultured Anaerotruncus sp.]
MDSTGADTAEEETAAAEAGAELDGVEAEPPHAASESGIVKAKRNANIFFMLIDSFLIVLNDPGNPGC